jgi:TIR domain
MGWEVGRAVFDQETPFFLSYAHAGSDSDQQAQHFFEELRGDVEPLMGLPVGSDMGFMDVVGLRGGMQWRPELIRALGSCQVLVALLSVPYLRSEWCGKEWHAFSLREPEPAPGAIASPNQGCIVPVRWAPIPFELPSVVKDEVTVFTPEPTRQDLDLPRRYTREGVFGLRHTGQEDSYREVVWQLAKLIQRIYYSRRLKPREFQPDELADVFQGGLP